MNGYMSLSLWQAKLWWLHNFKSISKTAALVRCCQSAVFRIYQRGHGWPSLSHAHLSRSYSHMYFIWLLLTFVILVSRAYLHLSSFSSSSSQITASSANIIVPSYPTSSVNLLITTANKGRLKADPCNLMSTLNTSLTPTAHLTTVLLSSYFPGTPDFLLQCLSYSIICFL